MNLICKNALISLVILTSLCTATNLKEIKLKNDSEEEDGGIDSDECVWDCDWKLSNGEIAAIVISILVILFGIPILLCFCCAWCCFRSRRKTRGTVVAVAAPTTQYVQQPQQYNNLRGQTRIIFTHSQPAYNVHHQHNESPLTNNGVHHAGWNNNGLHAPQDNSGAAHRNKVPTNNDNASQIYEQPPPYYEVASLSAESQPSAPMA